MTESTALLFPGQGAQEVGMGKELYEKEGIGAAVYDYADNVLDDPVSSLCFEGPKEKLTETRNSQPAILVTSLAYFLAEMESLSEESFQAPPSERFEEPWNWQNDVSSISLSISAGLSLGEYTALIASGALSFRDGLELVEVRANAMQEACNRASSGMVSVMGLNREELEEACEAVREDDVLCVSNINAPDQMVVSGEDSALRRLEERAEDFGAKRVIPLEVAGAFHSPLMKSAADKLDRALEQVEIYPPEFPVIANVTGERVDNPDTIRSLLSSQLTSPVLWNDSMNTLLQMELDSFWEVGPGSSLAGLMARIDRRSIRKFRQVPE